MGGSAIGGDLAAAAIGDRATGPLRVARGYSPGPWSPRTRSCCARRYSGATEETLACFEAAGASGAQRVALTTGGALAERAREEGVPVIGVPSGMQPRAAVVYMTVGGAGVRGRRGRRAVAAGRDRGRRRRCSRRWPTIPSRRAWPERCSNTIPVVHGAGLTAAVARRWKTQLNENAKVAAFASELPEANHNEIEGWEHGRELALALGRLPRGPGLHPSGSSAGSSSTRERARAAWARRSCGSRRAATRRSRACSRW